jgi:hypothetical protein
METDLLEGATCAGSDLAARLLAELARANDSLAVAEARVQGLVAAGRAPDAPMRAHARTCRRHVASLQRMLSGMPNFEGGSHAASA